MLYVRDFVLSDITNPQIVVPVKKNTLLLLFGFFFQAAFAQLTYLKEGSPLPSHPRIMLLAGEEKGIQQNIAQDKYWAMIHQSIVKESELLLTEPTLERKQIGRRLLAVSREALRRIFYLSYLYRVTREAKYLQRAEKELLAVCGFSDWNPSHFLDVAEMTTAVAIGYDWLLADLQPSSVAIIKEAILKKGIEPSLDSRYNSWLKATHNWNQVCNAGMSFGALAIYEENPALATQIIDRAIGSIQLPMKDYAPHGAYPEGYGYWGYGTSFNVLFLSAIEKAFGKDFGLASAAGFLQSATYYQQMVGTSGKTFNYADAGSGTGGVSPAVFWYANRTKDASLLFSTKNVLDANKANMGKDRILPAALIWGNGVRFDQVTAPKSLVWWGQGPTPVALMRSSWTDPNGIYLGLKAGSPSVNHAHMDVGSFVMDALGERWSMDFGMQDYESLESKGVKLWGREQDAERWRVFRYNNFVHSTLTLNGQLQRVEGSAKIESSTATPAFMSATTDISSLYKGEATTVKRGVAIVEKQYVQVQDEIKNSDKATTVRWVMLTPASVQIHDNNTVTLTQNGKKLTLQVTQPAQVTFKTWPTTPTHDYDAPNPGTTLVGFEVSLPPNATQTLNVLLLPADVKPNNARHKALSDWK
jgi:hypothetical protein